MQVTHVDDNVTHIVLGQKSSIGFTLAETPEFFQVLSKSLYTDPVLAMCRETVCNAWDAHIAAGITDTPIEITITDTELIITDFGAGIPKDKIGEIYTVYGKSTKSHDGKQTGGFGLGCKSPFAYTDHFTVESSCDGFTTVYALSLSSGEAYGIPTLKEMVSLPSDKTGLSVKIPLQRDCVVIRRNITNVCYRGNVLATINGQLHTGLALPEDWGFMESLSDHAWSIRYGNVIYPVPKHASIAGAWETCEYILKELGFSGRHGLVMQAPPDSISVAPSREALTMSVTTIETLQAMMQQFKQFFVSCVQDAITTHKQNISKLEKKEELFRYAFYGTNYKGVFPSSLKEKNDLINCIVNFHCQINGIHLLKLANHFVVERLHEIGFFTKDQFKLLRFTQFPLSDYHRFFSTRYTYGSRNRYEYDYFSGVKNPIQIFHQTLLKKMAKSDLVDLKKFYRYSNFVGDSVLYALKSQGSFPASPHECLLLAQKRVIVTRVRSALDKQIERHCHNECDLNRAYLVYHVGTSKKEYDAAIEFFTKMRYEILDFVPERITATRTKSGEPKKKRYGFLTVNDDIMCVNTYGIKFYGNYANDHSKTDQAEYTKTPDWVVKIAPNQQEKTVCTFIRNTANISQLFAGSTGGICFSVQKMKTAENADIPSIGDWLVNKCLAIAQANLTEAKKLQANKLARKRLNFYFSQLIVKMPYFKEYSGLGYVSGDTELETVISVLSNSAYMSQHDVSAKTQKKVIDFLQDLELSPRQQQLCDLEKTSTLFDCINWGQLYSQYHHLPELPRDVRKIISLVITNGVLK